MRAVGELRAIRAAFRDWPSIAAKGFLWKHLDLPRREMEIHSRQGTTIATPVVPNVGALYAAVEVFALGAYEHDWELEQEPVVIDIGANIGSWTLWLAERRPGLSGVCYEPEPAAAAYLRRNLKLNGLAERVEVRAEAVSDRSGTALLFQAQPADGASSLQPTSPVTRLERETRVRTVSFSEVMDRIEGHVSLVKMDCEGAEYDIVGPATAAAWARVKRVVLEYHPTPTGGSSDLKRRFAALGFAVVQERRQSGDVGTLWLARTAE